MSTDARGHTVPASTDHPSRADLLGLSLSIGDAIPVANVTARAALIVTLAGLGITASTASPISVWRADAPAGLQNEFTVDGTTFTPTGGAGSTMGTPTTTGTLGTATTGGTETRDAVLGNYSFTADAGHRYRVILDGGQIMATVTNDFAIVRIRNGGASTPTSGSQLVASSQRFVTAGSPAESLSVTGSFVLGAGTVTLGVFVVRYSGTGVLTPASTRELYAVDLGPA